VSFVPIADAHTNPAGVIVVHVTKDHVERAPRIESGDVRGPRRGGRQP
jgi:hypothetical protein